MSINSSNVSGNQKPIIVLGAGRHSKVLIEALRRSGRKIMGVTDPDKTEGESYFGIVVLGDDNAVLKMSPDEVELVNGVGAEAGRDLRWKLNERMEREGYYFAQVIHPSAVIGDNIFLDVGVQIMAGVVIQPGTRIGRSCIINTGVVIDHDCIISDECHIGPGATLSGSVVVGKGAHIGTGTSVIQDIIIGEDSIIAAGSIVYENIESNTRLIQKRKGNLVRKVLK